MGAVSPNLSLGVNLPSQNLFSQITSKLSESNLPATNLPKLSEVNPLDSLGNATAPLDAIWKAIGSKINWSSSIGSYTSGPLKSSLASRLSSKDTSTMGQAFGVAKSGLILIGNIFVAVLEIALWLIRGILSLVN